jgi:hypothetical protein
MAMAQVHFQLLTADAPEVSAETRKKFISITDVASWKLADEKGNVLYTGLIVSGPKPLPDGGFQMMAEFLLDMPSDPTKGIPRDAIPAIQNAVVTEFRKRAVIITQPGSPNPQ